jgi:hypothetical protein
MALVSYNTVSRARETANFRNADAWYETDRGLAL